MNNKINYNMPLLSKVYDYVFSITDDFKWIERNLDQIEAGSIMIDLGCANGRALPVALDKGWNAWGIDSSDDMIREAKKKLEPKYKDKVTLICGDYSQIDFPENVGLFTSLQNTWPLLNDQKMRSQLLGKIYKSLMKNGRFIVVLSNQTSSEGSSYDSETDTDEFGLIKSLVTWHVQREESGNKFRDVEVRIEKCSDNLVEEHFFTTIEIKDEDLISDAEKIGLKLLNTYGDYEGAPLDAEKKWRLFEFFKK